MKRFGLFLLAILIFGGSAWYFTGWRTANTTDWRTVKVTRATIIRKATAVGRIEVRHEVPVNSPSGGILTKLFVKAGQKVEAGTPLAEVRPVATEQAILAAERGVEQAAKGEAGAREYLEGKHLASQFSRLMLGEKNLQRMYDNATLNKRQAEEYLELLRKGTAVVDNRTVDFIVRASVPGHVLEIKQREGTPVVPASTYGSGTVFMTLADISQLLFRGTVDEIDVGRLAEGMAAQIKVGALAGASFKGTIEEIALKGTERNNAMVFDILMHLEAPTNIVLRAGYSAVADIEIERKTNVLSLPERVVEFRPGKALVRVPDGHGGALDKEIETGLSDGLTVEITQGLAEGEEVLERIAR